MKTAFSNLLTKKSREGLATLLFVLPFLVGCAGSENIHVLPKGQSQDSGSSGGDNPDTTLQYSCDEESRQETFNVQTDAIRGANVIFALDDSGSMTDEIDEVAQKVGTFIQTLIANSRDRLRLILVFSMTGAGGGNGSAFSAGAANPFQSLIDNQRIFHISEGVGSRGADIALFRSFALPTFAQRLPDLIPTDAGGAAAASCVGLGKYYRPRVKLDAGDPSLSQVSSACFQVTGSRSNLSSNPETPFTGPLGNLLPGVAVNLISFSDDDLNIAGDFSAATGNGVVLAHDMLSDIFKPLGDQTPVYYHSVVGLSTGGGVVRPAERHLGLTTATGGARADIRTPDYKDVFDELQVQISFSEQMVNLNCGVKAASTPRVLKDGDELASNLFIYSEGQRQIRMKPAAFSPEDYGRVVQFQVTYSPNPEVENP